MTKKQRMRAINYALQHSDEYNFLVSRKEEYAVINRALTTREMDEYCRIKDRMEQILESVLWLI